MGTLSEYGVDEKRLTEIADIQEESFIWFHNNLEDLQSKYSGNFVAIQSNKVIAKNKDKKELYKQLREEFTQEQVDEFFIDYVNPKGYIPILLHLWDRNEV